MINFINKSKKYKFSSEFNKNILQIYKYILEELNILNLNLLVSLIIVDDLEMQEICKIYYPNKKTTDVLAFKNDQDILKNQIGDIIISIDVVNKQYKNYYNNLNDEIFFLFIHGCLHLFGFNHINEKDYEIMKNHENKIFQKFKGNI